MASKRELETEVLTGAIGLIQRQGWSRGDYRGAHGEVCLKQAIWDAQSMLGLDNETLAEIDPVARVRRLVKPMGIESWNDQAQGAEDVLALLRKAL